MSPTNTAPEPSSPKPSAFASTSMWVSGRTHGAPSHAVGQPLAAIASLNPVVYPSTIARASSEMSNHADSA